jgi:hypothetical protein
MELIEKYVSPKRFAEICNPQIQFKLREMGAGYVMCKEMKAPTMREIRDVFGIETIQNWVSIQVDNLNDFCNVREKMTDKQKDELSHIIACQYGGLNIAEVSLMFMKVKGGDFGEFYGILDTVRFMSIIKKFMVERRYVLEKEYEKRKEEKEKEERESWKKDMMSRDELKKAISEGKFPTLANIGLNNIIGGK